jgi:hypothetical protein
MARLRTWVLGACDDEIDQELRDWTEDGDWA